MDSACSNDIESVAQQRRKSAPPILSTSHCEFNGARLCAHARKTIPLAPIHSFTKQMVPSLCPESLTRSLSRSFSPVLCVCLIKGFLPPKHFYACVVFLCFFVSFSSHTFSWACGSLREPWKFFSNSLFVYSLLCQITHLFLHGF